MATQFSQLLLATVAIFVLSLGHTAIDWLPFAPPETPTSYPWEQSLIPQDGGVHTVAVSLAELFTAPYRSVAEPGVNLLRLERDWSTAAYHWTRLLWALIVWSFFGAAITRIAAINFAVQQTLGPLAALRYAARRFLSFFTAPLVPIAAIVGVWFVLMVGGLIGSIETAGPYIAGVFWFAGLAVSFVGSLILIGLFGGWTLMTPTISTEDSDAFDGFSRSFSYVFSRTRLWAGLILAGLFLGIVLTSIVVALGCLAVHITNWGMSSCMGLPDVAALTVNSPFALGEPLSQQGAAVPEGATAIVQFWLSMGSLVIHGFAASLFWSLATISFFLLRQSDDATSLDEVFLNPEDEPDDLLPLVGVAASEQPVIERSLEKDPGIRSDQDGAQRPESETADGN